MKKSTVIDLSKNYPCFCCENNKLSIDERPCFECFSNEFSGDYATDFWFRPITKPTGCRQ